MISGGRTPFDQENLLGYFTAWSLECVGGFFLLAVFAVNLAHFTGSCKILTSITDDLNVELRDLNRTIVEGTDPTEFTIKLHEFIQFYADAKQFSVELTPALGFNVNIK